MNQIIWRGREQTKAGGLPTPEQPEAGPPREAAAVPVPLRGPGEGLGRPVCRAAAVLPRAAGGRRLRDEAALRLRAGVCGAGGAAGAAGRGGRAGQATRLSRHPPALPG